MNFKGFTAETLAWFHGLMLDNSRAYFVANREVYENAVKQPLEALLGDLSCEFGGKVKLFRPYRDIRFSADKTPYKTTASGLLIDVADTEAAFYVAVSVDGIAAASGYYGMRPDQLQRYRQSLTEGNDPSAICRELRAVLDDLRAAGMEADTDSMKGMPRGFSKDLPDADLLRVRSMTIMQHLEAERILDASARDWIANVWQAAKPMNAWLDAHVGPSTDPDRR